MKNLPMTLVKLVAGLGFLLVILWLGGMFAQPAIGPGVAAAPPGEPAPRETGTAERVQHPIHYHAVGSVASEREVQLAARVPGQILRLSAEVGDRVSAGDLLAELDARDIQARVKQAHSGLDAARARATQARQAEERVRRLVERQAATPAQLEEAVAGLAAAEAGVVAAREGIAEAEVALDFTRVVAPMDGVVSARPAEVGDLAWPGMPIFTLIDPAALRVEAWVREGALDHVQVGRSYPVEIPSRGLTLDAVVEEIVPAVDPRSRTLQVRAALPQTEGLHAGMFARLVLEVGTREVVEVESDAIRRIGQLDTTLVREGSRWVRRYVTLGESQGNRTEVLSGLAGGETLGWSATQ